MASWGLAFNVFKRPAFDLIHVFLNFNENNIIQNFRPIPPSMYHNLRIIKLSRMPHSRLWSFPYNLWKYPFLAFSVQHINVVQNFLPSISLPPPKNNQELSKNRRTMTISRTGSASFQLYRQIQAYIIKHMPY